MAISPGDLLEIGLIAIEEVPDSPPAHRLVSLADGLGGA